MALIANSQQDHVMKRQESLDRGRGFLDEATENLTFDEYHWALEEVWRGTAWVLNALADEPKTMLGLGAKGRVPPRGTLAPLVGLITDLPKEAKVVGRLEALHRKIFSADDLEIALAVNAEAIEDAVFSAWELHDVCGQRLGLVDERLGDKLVLTDVSPGRVGSKSIHRRTALKLLLAGSVVPLKACSKVEKDNRPPAAKAEAEPADGATANAEPSVTLRSVEPLNGTLWKTSDPFLFCAYHLDDYPEGNGEMGPAASLAGRHLGRDFEGKNNWRMYHGRKVPGFPRHPHRGFETVTVVRRGRLDHADSMGATARYGSGDVQWLTAGGGIQHAEMFPLLETDAPNPLELYQIWLNLPRRNKLVEPHFKMLWSESIPRVSVEDAKGRVTQVTVTAGAYGDERPPAPPPNSWASAADSDVAIWTLRMEPGARFELPAVNIGTERSLYIHRGSGMTVAGREVSTDRRVILDGNGTLELVNGSEETEILLLQGQPIGEPVARRGPFVMNTQQEIRQAYADYQRTQFGGWPWREGGPVHDPSKDRFAKHIDGTYEEPT